MTHQVDRGLTAPLLPLSVTNLLYSTNYTSGRFPVLLHLIFWLQESMGVTDTCACQGGGAGVKQNI